MAITKKDMYKLNPGTWLVIGWNDSAPTPALLLEKPERSKGDVSLKCFYPGDGEVHSRAVHTQINYVSDHMLVVPGDEKLVLRELAQAIQDECQLYYETCPDKAQRLNEPYRAAGDRLVDKALALIN